MPITTGWQRTAAFAPYCGFTCFELNGGVRPQSEESIQAIAEAAEMRAEMAAAAAAEEEAINWPEVYSAYLHWYNNMGDAPRYSYFDDIEEIEHVAPNYIFHDLIVGDLNGAAEHMKNLFNFIQRIGFQCQDPHAMEALSAAIEEVADGHPEMAIQLMRQFEAGIIVGIPRPSNADFEAYRRLVLARVAEHQAQQPSSNEQQEEEDREWASSVLAASIMPASVVDDFMYGGRFDHSSEYE